jgi:hypothetical protein
MSGAKAITTAVLCGAAGWAILLNLFKVAKPLAWQPLLERGSDFGASLLPLVLSGITYAIVGRWVATWRTNVPWWALWLALIAGSISWVAVRAAFQIGRLDTMLGASVLAAIATAAAASGIAFFLSSLNGTSRANNSLERTRET